jgi:uncharacterized membrane protein
MTDTYLKAACLGIIAGMRSMGAPALVSDCLARDQPEALAESPLRWLGTPTTAKVFKFLAAGEIVGDKLPKTPSRIDPGPLFGRIMSGGLSGAGLFAADGKRPVVGAAVGALAAIAGAYGFYHLRQTLGKRLPVPDPVLGAAEDVLAFGMGWRVLKTG